MSWALHYAIELKRELSPEESLALGQLCEKRALTLQRVVVGVGRMAEWKGLIPDDEYARLEALLRASPETPAEGSWHYRGFIQLGSMKQLCRVVAWLREVERLLPVATFVISEDYSITEPCRPSQVDLEALERKAQAERAAQLSEEEEEEDLPVEGQLEEDQAFKARIEEGLALARKDFALWKNAQPKK